MYHIFKKVYTLQYKLISFEYAFYGKAYKWNEVCRHCTAMHNLADFGTPALLSKYCWLYFWYFTKTTLLSCIQISIQEHIKSFCISLDSIILHSKINSNFLKYNYCTLKLIFLLQALFKILIIFNQYDRINSCM